MSGYNLINLLRLGITCGLLNFNIHSVATPLGFMDSMRMPTFGEYTCPEPGLFPVKSDCRKYYKCMFSGMNAFGVIPCPGNQRFDPVDRKCDRGDIVDCDRCSSDGIKPEQRSTQYYIVCTKGYGTRKRCQPAGTNFDQVNMKCPEGFGSGSLEPSEELIAKPKSGSHASARTDVRGGSQVMASSRNESSGATALATSEGAKSSRATAMANQYDNGTAKARAHATSDNDNKAPGFSNNNTNVLQENRTTGGDSETWNSRTLATAFNENGMTASAMAEGKGQSSAQATQNETNTMAESETLGAQGGAAANSTEAQTWSYHNGTNGSVTAALATNNLTINSMVSDAKGYVSTNISENGNVTVTNSSRFVPENREIPQPQTNSSSSDYERIQTQKSANISESIYPWDFRHYWNIYNGSTEDEVDTNSNITTTSKPVSSTETETETDQVPDQTHNKTVQKRSAAEAGLNDSRLVNQSRSSDTVKSYDSNSFDRFSTYDQGPGKPDSFSKPPEHDSRFSDRFSRYDPGSAKPDSFHKPPEQDRFSRFNDRRFDSDARPVADEFGGFSRISQQEQSTGVNSKRITDRQSTSSSSKTKKSTVTSFQSMKMTTEVNGTKQISKSESDITNTAGTTQNEQLDSKTRTEVIKKNDETVNVAHEEVAANETVVDSKAAIVESHVQIEESKNGRKVGELKTNQATAESETYFDRIAVQVNTTNSTLKDFEGTQKNVSKIDNLNSTTAEAGTHVQMDNTTGPAFGTDKQESARVETQLSQGSKTNEIQNSRGTGTQNLTHQDSKAVAQLQTQIESKSDTTNATNSTNTTTRT